MAARVKRTPARRLPPLGWLLLLLLAFAGVVWRQTRCLELERQLADVRDKQAIIESQRLEAVGQIHFLGRRSRIVREASTRLGLRVPADSEVVRLPVAP